MCHVIKTPPSKGIPVLISVIVDGFFLSTSRVELKFISLESHRKHCFVSGFLWALTCLRDSSTSRVAELCPFSLLYTIPLFDETVIYFSIILLMVSGLFPVWSFDE